MTAYRIEENGTTWCTLEAETADEANRLAVAIWGTDETGAAGITAVPVHGPRTYDEPPLLYVYRNMTAEQRAELLDAVRAIAGG
jgi:hypothetical protein